MQFTAVDEVFNRADFFQIIYMYVFKVPKPFWYKHLPSISSMKQLEEAALK